MPSTINIWEEGNMASCAQIGGSWTYTGSITPAPTAPLTYNGTADFTGITTSGDYEFTYTVGSHSSVHTVTYGYSNARVNDTCAASRFISDVGTGFAEINDYNDSKCPGYSEPTDSGESIPGSWQYGTYTGDLWYYFDVPAKNCNYSVVVSIDGSAYTSEGVFAPALAIYSNTSQDCGTKSFVVGAAESSQQDLTISTTFPPYTQQRIWIRVASVTAGDFDLTVRTVFPTGCEDVGAEATNTWGYPTGNVFGDETGEVWGY